MSNIQKLEKSESGSAETVQKRGKMKVQSVSTVSLDNWLRVQKDSVWGTKVTKGPK